MTTLVHLDLARRDHEACFRSGARPLQWAGAWNGQAVVVASFQKQAQALSALASETVMLAALDGTDVVYLACRPGQRALEINFRVGGRLPAAIASSGKAMLATQSDAQIRDALAGHRFERVTRHSVSSLGALLKQLRQCRATGLAVDDEEAAEGMLCLGAAIHRSTQTLSPLEPDLSMAPARNAVAVSVIKAGLSARRRRELEQGVKSLAKAMPAGWVTCMPAPTNTNAKAAPMRPSHKLSGVASDSSSTATGMMDKPPNSSKVPIHKYGMRRRPSAEGWVSLR